MQVRLYTMKKKESSFCIVKFNLMVLKFSQRVVISALKGTIMIINAIIIRILHTSLRAVIAYFSPKIITFFAKEKFRACRAVVSSCYAQLPIAKLR